MRLNWLVLIPLLLAPVLSACGKSNSNKAPAAPHQEAPQPTPYANSTRASRLADEFSLSCQTGKCPESVGVLFFSNYGYSGTCTAWVAGELEGKTVLMTNRHCVERVQDCAQELAFRIPSTQESAQCSRMLKISEFALSKKDSALNIVPDYAIILLDRKLTAAALPLSQQGLAPKSPITIRKAWSMGSRSIEMREQACETGTANLLVGNYTSLTSPNVTLYGCEVKSGVSGSPILNAQGEAAAIVQIGPKGSNQRLPEIPGLETAEFDMQTFGVGTNLTCVNFPSLGLNPGATCAADMAAGQVSQFKAETLFSEKMLLKGIAADHFKFISGEDSRLFVWTVRPDDGNRVGGFGGRKGLLTLELVPACILPIEEEGNPMRKKYYEESGYFGVGGGWKSNAFITLRSPGWTAGLKADKYGKINLKFRTGTKTAIYSFSPAQIATLKGNETVVVTETAMGLFIHHKLALCKPGQLAQELKDAEELKQILESDDDRALDDFMKRSEEREKRGL